MHITLKKSLLTAALCLPLLASAQNLVSNGSFSSGLTGWTSTASAGVTFPVAVINYGAPGSAFGEIIPADNAVSLSPDAVGTTGVYFVEDNGTLTLSQTFTVATAGSYNVGFDTYVPANGFSNPGAASFSGRVDSTSVLTTSVGSLAATTWRTNTGTINLSAGSHTVSFSFLTTGGPSKDLVVDRVYVVATPVPEPQTYVMMGLGLAAIGLFARRRRAA